MSTPSLLIVPARIKAGSTFAGSPGILYSQIPTNGNGDFSLQRDGLFQTIYNDQGLIERVGTNNLSNVIPRLDYYTSSGTPGCPGLLVEPSGSNLALRSAGFEVSGTWAPTNTSITTGTTAAFTAPDNSTDADLLTSTTSGSLFVGQSIAIASGTYTISVFAKAGTSHIFSLGNVSRNLRGAWFNLNAGAVTGTVNGGTASMQNYGNGWYRCIYTSSGMVSGTATLIVGLADAANGLTATSGTNLYVWGAQLETGSIATSYIPTTTGSVNRNADVISVSGNVSGSIGQTEGSIYAEVNIQKLLGTTQRAIVDIGQSGNRLFLGYGNGLTNQIRFLLQTSLGGLVDINSSATSTGTIKIAVGYKNNDSIMYVNGVIGTFVSNDSFTSSLNTLTGLSIGSSNIVGETHFLNDRINAVALYATRLSNDALMLLSMQGNDAYLPQAVWNFYEDSRTGNTEIPDCLYTRHADLLDV